MNKVAAALHLTPEEFRRRNFLQEGETTATGQVIREKLELDEKKFRWMLNDNAMAYEKTGEGIRKFAVDVIKLEKVVASRL